MNDRDTTIFVLFLVGMLLLFGLGIYAQFYAPCSWHAGNSMKDVPARCVGPLLKDSED